MRVLLLLVVAVLVNLPWVHESRAEHRIAERGRLVAAEVVGTHDLGDRYLVDYRLPDEVDPERRTFSASVDDLTYDRAVASDVIAVRVIPGEPASNRAEGLVASSLLEVLAIAADVVLVLGVAVWWWVRRRSAV